MCHYEKFTHSSCCSAAPLFCENCAPWFSMKKSAFLVLRMQNHFCLIVCNKSAHKSGGIGMQQQQKQPFSIQHIAAHSICRSKYLNKFFWLPTKHYLNFLLLLLFLFFLKITLMHICYFSKIRLEQPFSTCCASSSCCSCCFDLSRVRNFFKKTCYLSFSRHFAAYEKMKKVWRRKNCT